MSGDVLVTLRGLVTRGKDGQHHDAKCCRFPVSQAWTAEEKGLGDPIFLSALWRLPALPAPGDTIFLPDGGGEQDVSVRSRAFRLDGTVEVWLGGWQHWSTDSVVDLFRRAQERGAA